MEDVFEQWFLANGGYIDPGVEIATDKVTGRHMRVTNGEDVTAGSLIVSCPHELTISWLNVVSGSETFLSQFDLGDAYHAVNQVVIVRFFLVNEYLKGQESFWWPYIRSLPQPDETHLLGTPLYYDDLDFPWIRGTNLEHAARKTERMWHIEYDEAMESLVPTQGSHAMEWSWSLYKWAATIMSSRCFPASALANNVLMKDAFGDGNPDPPDSADSLEPGSPVLIPGIDLLNHRPSAKVTWQWTSISCRLVTNETLAAGTQIWNNYGQKSNEELILGYGFSIADNPADHCGLTVVSDAGRFHQDLDFQNGQSHEHTGVSQSHLRGVAELKRVHWVRLRNTIVDKIRLDAKASYEFSPGFLDEIATALCNDGEKTASQACLQDQNDFSNDGLSRQKLKVMATIVMLVQRQLSDILKYDAHIPKWPDNERQFHAARYRRGQLHIFRTVNTSLLGTLSGLSGVNGNATRDFRVVRLEHMLVESPSPLLADFRAALNAGLGTRKAAKIRDRGWVECAFTLWVCGVWLYGQSSKFGSLSLIGKGLESTIASWIVFLRQAYPDNPTVQHTSPTNGYGQSSPTAAAIEEEASLVDSSLCVIQAAVQKNPSSLYNNPACTKSRLTWCVNIVKQESVMCPDFEGKSGDKFDEMVLFIESHEAI